MMTLKAWAKINIGLKILDKRDDGYHNVETTLANINLADIIEIEEIPSGITVESEGVDIPQQDNLCYRAAVLLQKRYGLDRGVRVKLVKNIPVGAGLGGGSSDAACVLKGMNRLFDVGLPDEDLMDCARELGVDVPFFIKGGAAYARGRGDELTFFRLPRMSLVLYYPGYPVSTEWAYQEYDKFLLTLPKDTDIIDDKNSEKRKKKLVVFELLNDFEKVVFEKHPDLLDIKAHMISLGVFLVSLSGSGSCLFSVVDDKNRKRVVDYFDGLGAEYYEVMTI